MYRRTCDSMRRCPRSLTKSARVRSRCDAHLADAERRRVDGFEDRTITDAEQSFERDRLEKLPHIVLREIRREGLLAPWHFDDGERIDEHEVMPMKPAEERLHRVQRRGLGRASDWLRGEEAAIVAHGHLIDGGKRKRTTFIDEPPAEAREVRAFVADRRSGEVACRERVEVTSYRFVLSHSARL